MNRKPPPQRNSGNRRSKYYHISPSRVPPILFPLSEDPNSYRGMQTVAAHVHHVIDRNAGEQPMPFDHHRPSLVASVSQTRSVSGAITSGGAAVNIRLTDWTEHRSRPNQPRRTTLHREPSPPAPGDGFFAVRDMR